MPEWFYRSSEGVLGCQLLLLPIVELDSPVPARQVVPGYSSETFPSIEATREADM